MPRVPAILREDAPFRLLFAGQALSVVGDRITPVAIAFAVLAIGSPTDLGIVMAAGGIPFGLFAIAGGVLSDRVGRRHVMLASDVVRAAGQALTAGLLLSGRAEVWMLAVLSAVYGTSAAVFRPALMGLIPQTVAPGRLQDANALLGVTRSVASIAGPALAGLILAASGPGLAIAVDAATFAVIGACTQAAIIGSGLGTAGIAAGLLLAGVAVSLFFTLWDTSIQEQVPAHAVSRVSSYDFAVSLGLMPLGMALAGPLAGALGLHATLRAMSALGILVALAWLAVPSGRRVRRAPAPPARATPPAGATPD